MVNVSVSQRLLRQELERRGCKLEILDETDTPFIRYTSADGKEHYLKGLLSEKTNAVACRITANKVISTSIAERLGLPVPETQTYRDQAAAQAFLDKNKQVVVKPLDAAHGNGITLNIAAIAELQAAVERALQFSDTVLLQQQVRGQDFRLLFIGGVFCAAVERQPASVVGDGTHTIRELIAITNTDPDRGKNYEKKLNFISIKQAELFLGEKIDTLVPSANEEVAVVGTANIGTGGKAFDATDSLDPKIMAAGKKLVDELKIGVCGVDFMAGEDGFYFIEMNNSPMLSLHHFPYAGQPRDVVSNFADWLLG